MTPSISAESRNLIDAYLDAVDLALIKSNAPRTRRTAIMADLESHILDALLEKSESPTPADVAAVLATLGPAQAYANGMTQIGMPSPAPRPRRTLPAHAKWAAALLPTGWIGIAILMAAFGRHIYDPSDFLLLMIASTPVILMILLASLLGFVSYQAIRKEPRRHWGKPIAFVEMLGFPFLLLLASPVLFFAALFAAALAFSFHHLYDLRATTRDFIAAS